MANSGWEQSGGVVTPEDSPFAITPSPRLEALFPRPTSTPRSAGIPRFERAWDRRLKGPLQGPDQAWKAPSKPHDAPQAVYICSCSDNNNNSLANTCRCSECHLNLQRRGAPCEYLGQCIEPLAWTIENDAIPHQPTSPLFTLLPRELRDLVYRFALTDSVDELLRHGKCDEKTLHQDNIRILPGGDMAINLLSTCRAVYMETWSLPLRLNPVASRMRSVENLRDALGTLLPWQFALIQRLDISMPQLALEGMGLRGTLFASSGWLMHTRQQGTHFVAPQLYRPNSQQHQQERVSHVLCHPPTPTTFKSFSFNLLPLSSLSSPSSCSLRRLSTPSPLTHLTIRLPRRAWWTWIYPPHSPFPSPDPLHHLALDPSIGDGRKTPHSHSRPSHPEMLRLAAARLAGTFPLAADLESPVGWAQTIAPLAHLKRLTLVLEAFAEKKDQLDEVARCARTWVFPLEGGNANVKLCWDGEVESMGWSTSVGVGADAGDAGDALPVQHQQQQQQQQQSSMGRPAGLFGRARREQRWWTESVGVEVRGVSFVRG